MVDISYVLGYPLVEHGLMALDKHVDRMNRFLNTTEGRDKFTKVVQNIARVLSFVAGLRSHAWKDISERLNHLDRASSTCRKFLKLGTAFTFVRLFFRYTRVRVHMCMRLYAYVCVCMRV